MAGFQVITEGMSLGSARVMRQFERAELSVILVAVKTTGLIQHITAVTFAICDMARSIEFYEKLGFELFYGGGDAGFSSLKAGKAFSNLVANSQYEHRWWVEPFSESMAWMRTTAYCGNED